MQPPSMDIRVKDAIDDQADEIVSQLQARQTSVEAEILKLEQQLSKLQAESDAIRLAPDRAANMDVFIGGHYQCPWCSHVLMLLRRRNERSGQAPGP